jgi:hypothetical protein
LWHDNTLSGVWPRYTQTFLYHQELNVQSPHKKQIFELGFGNVKIRAI